METYPSTRMPGLPSTPERNFTGLVVAGGIVGFVLLIVAGLIFGINMIRSAVKRPALVETPTAETVTEPKIVMTPSKFATDAGVLKLRDDLKSLSAKIDSIDLFEPQISPPAVDLGINIR